MTRPSNPSHHGPRLCLAAVVGLSAFLTTPGNLQAQRGVRQMTGIGASVVKISPDGNWVAFKTTDNGLPALAVISTAANSKPVIHLSDASFTHFFFTPDSSGIYYQVASSINFIRTIGGASKLISNVPGINPRMFAVDSQDAFLVGTRGNTGGGYSIFTVPTDGSTLPLDIRASPNDFFGEVALDPSGTKIAYTSQVVGVPHAPIDIRAVDVAGTNDLSMSGGDLPRMNVQVSLPRNLIWADNGVTLLFTAADTANTTWEIMRVTVAGLAPEPMTLRAPTPAPAQNYLATTISPDRSLVAFFGTTFHGHVCPGVMPSAGGARVFLEPESNWEIACEPSLDQTGLKLAFAGYPAGTIGGRPNVQLIELDREIVVQPRPELGQSVQFDLPLRSNERGTLFLSTGLAPADPKLQIALPGLTYAVALDPGVLVPLISGVGTGTPLTFNATVPNLSALVGFTVYLQGMRLVSTNPDDGDFTRYAELQFFQ